MLGFIELSSLFRVNNLYWNVNWLDEYYGDGCFQCLLNNKNWRKLTFVYFKVTLWNCLKFPNWKLGCKCVYNIINVCKVVAISTRQHNLLLIIIQHIFKYIILNSSFSLCVYTIWCCIKFVQILEMANMTQFRWISVCCLDGIGIFSYSHPLSALLCGVQKYFLILNGLTTILCLWKNDQHGKLYMNLKVKMWAYLMKWTYFCLAKHFFWCNAFDRKLWISIKNKTSMWRWFKE